MTRFLSREREREVVEDLEMIVFCSFCILSLYIYKSNIILLLTTTTYFVVVLLLFLLLRVRRV